jgi:hypothetical protein
MPALVLGCSVYRRRSATANLSAHSGVALLGRYRQHSSDSESSAIGKSASGLPVTQTTIVLRPSPNARCRFPLYANYPTLKIRLDTGVDRMTDV